MRKQIILVAEDNRDTRDLFQLMLESAGYDVIAKEDGGAAMDISNNRIQNARIALGGVAHKPWRPLEAEKILTGATADKKTFVAAAEIAIKSAQPQKHNAFKIEMAKRAIVRVLDETATGKSGGAA